MSYVIECIYDSTRVHRIGEGVWVCKEDGMAGPIGNMMNKIISKPWAEKIEKAYEDSCWRTVPLDSDFFQIKRVLDEKESARARSCVRNKAPVSSKARKTCVATAKPALKLPKEKARTTRLDIVKMQIKKGIIRRLERV